MKRTYLDFAAAAPVSKGALRAHTAVLKQFGNPSSVHAEGRAARAILEDARLAIARMAGVKADAVLFTSGATEANALAIVGSIQALIEQGRSPESMHILYLSGAHASTIGAVAQLKERGVLTEELRITDGAIDLPALAKQLQPGTVLVAVDVVCGEMGALYNVRDVRRALDAARKGGGERILLHADASQAPRVTPYELTRLGADTLSLDAQKVGGVRGIGALIAPRSVTLSPIMRGGGQERGLRPGTESPALAAAFAVALAESDEERESFTERAVVARALLLKTLNGSLPNLFANEGREQAPSILNLSLLGRDTDYLVALLDEAGYAVSTRSACETESEEGSRAVLALTGDQERARATLRVSWGPGTKTSDLTRFANALIKAVRFLDEHPV
jgi:cysteine desulfurase